MKNIVFRKHDGTAEKVYPSAPVDYFDIIDLIESDLEFGEGQVGTIKCPHLALQVHQNSTTPANDWRRIVHAWMSKATDRRKDITLRQVL